MKKIISYTPIKIIIFTIIYFIILLFISPTIDHFFTTLEEDKKLEENNFEILFEIILQLLTIILIWYFLNNFISSFIKNKLKIKLGLSVESGIDIVTAITLVGLQKNLIDKLEYITIEHPFRLSDIDYLIHK